MTTSLYDRVVAMPANAAAAYSPVDTVTARAIHSNLSHLSDQAAQVLASWVVSSPLFIFDKTSNAFNVAWTSAAFPVRYRPDGAPYRLRVALNAAKVGTPNILIQAFVMPGNIGPNWQTYASRITSGAIPATARAEATITSTTPSWLTLDRTWIQLQEGATTPLGDTGERRMFRQTLDAIGGRPATASYDTQRVVVMSRRLTTGTSALDLRGVHLAEFVGPS